jgi:AraC-like DNA-binding protein
MDIIGDESVPKLSGFHVMHWHEDFQFIYVVSGSIYIHTLFQIETICKGQAIFINKNVVHEVQGSDDCHYKSILFPEHLIEFYPGGPAKRFVTVLAENSQLITQLFYDFKEWHKNVLGLLRSLIELENMDTLVYEYEVLVLISRIWLEIIRNIQVPIENLKTETSVRMQKFLKYIEQHYGDDLSLENLAKSASVSKSECLRCFKQTLQTTPYKYLMQYRLQESVILLQETNLPIGYIADKVGFHQVSHFGKCFKEKMGCSPKEYRKKSNSY